jgi:hypothetical protein
MPTFIYLSIATHTRMQPFGIADMRQDERHKSKACGAI